MFNGTYVKTKVMLNKICKILNLENNFKFCSQNVIKKWHWLMKMHKNCLPILLRKKILLNWEFVTVVFFWESIVIFFPRTRLVCFMKLSGLIHFRTIIYCYIFRFTKIKGFFLYIQKKVNLLWNKTNYLKLWLIY